MKIILFFISLLTLFAGSNRNAESIMERRALSEKQTLEQFQNKLLLIQKRIKLITYGSDHDRRQILSVNAGLWRIDYYKHDRLLDYFNQVWKPGKNFSSQYYIDNHDPKNLVSLKRNLAICINSNKAARIGYNELVVLSKTYEFIIPWNFRNVAEKIYSLAYKIECWISMILNLDVEINTISPY